MIEDYRLIRSRKRKKTITLTLSREGIAIVRAPYGVPVAEIALFVEKKRVWLNRKMAEFKADHRDRFPVSLNPGEGIFYLGESYPFCLQDDHAGGKDTLIWTGNAFHLMCRNLSAGKALLGKWYERQARDFFPTRVAHYGSIMGVVPSSIRVSSARFRFGSCSAGKRVSLSWRLMMAPLEVIDSVIIHELSHLKEMNHSERFWSFVCMFCPDYGRHKKWLKTEGKRLMEF
jgi:predicted metal-dependent hydrolase